MGDVVLALVINRTPVFDGNATILPGALLKASNFISFDVMVVLACFPCNRMPAYEPVVPV